MTSSHAKPHCFFVNRLLQLAAMGCIFSGCSSSITSPVLSPPSTVLNSSEGVPLETERIEENIDLYFDGTLEAISAKDIGIIFALSQGIETNSIPDYVNTVLADRLAPLGFDADSDPVIEEDVTSLDDNPINVSDFDGDKIPAGVTDAAVLLSIEELDLIESERMDQNDVISSVESFVQGLSISPDYEVTNRSAILALVPAKITFTDPNLEAAVRIAIEKSTGDILTEDIDNLIVLNADNAEIESLEGIEALTSLRILNLTVNQIEDLKPLASLTDLTQLFLTNNDISDLVPLNMLTSLVRLEIAQNQVTDLTPLSTLTELTQLQLASNQISNLDPLSELTNLEILNLAANQIEDIQALVDNSGFGNGDLIDLRNNPLNSNTTDVLIPELQERSVEVLFESNEIIFADPNLEAVVRDTIDKPTGSILPVDVVQILVLNAESAEITSLEGIESLTNLTILGLSQNQITDLTPLQNLTGLTQLFLSNNSVTDLNPLANLASLTQLQINQNQIQDLTPLANLTSLTELEVAGNQVNDLTPLAGLTSLEDLTLAMNQIEDIQALVDNTGLDDGDRVDLRNNPLSSNAINLSIPSLQNRSVQVLFSPAEIIFADPNLEAAVRTEIGKPEGSILTSDVVDLTSLDVQSAAITSLEGIEFLTNLTILGLINSEITDLMPLQNLTNLTQLFLTQNNISDLTPLANLTNLTRLQIAQNQIVDLTPLTNLTNLTELQLAANQIVDLTPLSNLTNLETLILAANQIEDIQPLVDNPGLNTGDTVALENNPLSQNSINIGIPTLQSRSVEVLFTDPFEPVEILVSDPLSRITELEFDQRTGKFTWVDLQRNLWVGDTDPITGDLVPPNGKGTLVDTGLATLDEVSNGPEFAISQNETQIVYTKKLEDGRFALAVARYENGEWLPRLLTNGEDRALPVGSIDPLSNMLFVLYGNLAVIPGSTTLAVRELDNHDSEQLIGDAISARFAEGLVNGSPAITFSSATQLFLYDINAGQASQITFDAGSKRGSFIWRAPEYNNEQLLYALTDREYIGIYRNIEGQWRQIHVVNPPSRCPIIHSPEVFTHNGKSYIVVVTLPEECGPTEVWLAGIDPVNPFYRELSDTKLETRIDPEVYIAEQGPMVYFNTIFQDNDFSTSPVKVLRVDMGLGPAQ